MSCVARSVFGTLPPVATLGEMDLTQREADKGEVSALLSKFGLQRAVTGAERDWDFGAALGGNYFDTVPTFV